MRLIERVHKGKRLKNNFDKGNISLIYTKDRKNKGLIETYGEELRKAFEKRNKIGIESLKYIRRKTKDLTF